MSTSVSVNTLPDWLVETLKKIERLSQLSANWDSYGAQPVKAEILGLSIRLLGSLEGESLPNPLVSAGSAGTVDFEWQFQGRELEVEILDQDRVEYLKVYPDGRMEEGEISPNFPDGLRRLIRWLLHGD
ncbi:MAG: hypothetical protein HYU36_23860 [Planctomycetes bacterium]|nr:hypothetical protein [Planctomycetota bacterium]